MSIYTWTNEFCPIDVGCTLGWSDVQRLERDLRKWIGLRRRNLDKHAVRLDGCTLYELGVGQFHIAEQCGCCKKYKECVRSTSLGTVCLVIMRLSISKQ